MNETGSRTTDLIRFAEKLGLEFSNISLLDRALTHASAVTETETPSQHYQALEFLGDAILGAAVAHYLYENAPEHSPGELSKMRASVVNRRTLTRIAHRLQIAVLIRLGKGEELSGGRKRAALLEDTLESLIGAVYLDQGWFVAQRFILNLFANELDSALCQNTVWDYKSRLQHFCQSHHISLPEFVLIRSTGPDHQKEFEIEVHLEGHPAGRGTGRTKKDAEQRAAREALQLRESGSQV